MEGPPGCRPTARGLRSGREECEAITRGVLVRARDASAGVCVRVCQLIFRPARLHPGRICLARIAAKRDRREGSGRGGRLEREATPEDAIYGREAAYTCERRPSPRARTNGKSAARSPLMEPALTAPSLRNAFHFLSADAGDEFRRGVGSSIK